MMLRVVRRRYAIPEPVSRGMQTDEQWCEVARVFVAAMGFDDNDGARAPCQWVEVRHGVSANGNDHIHLVVNLVREDGTNASPHCDFYRMVCRGPMERDTRGVSARGRGGAGASHFQGTETGRC